MSETAYQLFLTCWVQRSVERDFAGWAGRRSRRRWCDGDRIGRRRSRLPRLCCARRRHRRGGTEARGAHEPYRAIPSGCSSSLNCPRGCSTRNRISRLGIVQAPSNGSRARRSLLGSKAGALLSADRGGARGADGALVGGAAERCGRARAGSTPRRRVGGAASSEKRAHGDREVELIVVVATASARGRGEARGRARPSRCPPAPLARPAGRR